MKVSFDQIKTTQNQQDRLVQSKTITVMEGDKIYEPVRVHWYSSKGYDASVLYCLVRIRGHGVSLNGVGNAGGTRCSRLYESFENAITSAGVKLDKEVDKEVGGAFGGAVVVAVDRTMKAIASRLGYKGESTIIHS